MEIMVIVRGLWYEVVNQNNSELWDMVLKVKKKKTTTKTPNKLCPNYGSHCQLWHKYRLCVALDFFLKIYIFSYTDNV